MLSLSQYKQPLEGLEGNQRTRGRVKSKVESTVPGGFADIALQLLGVSIPTEPLGVLESWSYASPSNTEHTQHCQRRCVAERRWDHEASEENRERGGESHRPSISEAEVVSAQPSSGINNNGERGSSCFAQRSTASAAVAQVGTSNIGCICRMPRAECIRLSKGIIPMVRSSAVRRSFSPGTPNLYRSLSFLMHRLYRCVRSLLLYQVPSLRRALGQAAGAKLT